MKGLINFKSNENKYFLWFHIRHLNPFEGINRADKEMINDLD